MTDNETHGASQASFPSVSPPAIPPSQHPVIVQVAPPRRSFFRRLLVSMLAIGLIISLVLNAYLAAFVNASLKESFDQKTLQAGSEQQVVAVYDVSGVINAETAAAFDRFYRDVANNTNVKAVVIRVDSPGGGVGASDEIYHRIDRLKSSHGKKIVISMGSVAASGGYYISAPADEIFAEPTTITGSIGVLMQWPVIKEGLSKIGVEVITYKSTNAKAWKDEISPFGLPDERQQIHLHRVLDTMQARFEMIVHDGRGNRLKIRKPNDEETEPFNGKIYMTDEARTLGLIDSVGYLNDAIDRAAKLADLDHAKVVHYTAKTPLLARFLGGAKAPVMGIEQDVIDNLQTPRVMMLWKVD